MKIIKSGRGMERLAEELEGLAACCPEGKECSEMSEDELEQDSCELCWKAWLLMEREEKPRNAGDGVPYRGEE